MESYPTESHILVPVILATIVLFCAITFFILPNNKTVANKYLVLFFLMLFMMYVIMSFFYSPIYFKLNWIYLFYFFNYSSTLMLFLYIQTSLINQVNVFKRYYFAMIPSLVFLFLIFYNINDIYTDDYLDHYKNPYHFSFKLFFEISLNIISLVTVYKYAKSIKHTYSSHELYQYKWIKFIIISSIVFSTYPRLMALLSNVANRNTQEYHDYYGMGLVSLIYFSIIYIKVLLNSKNTIPIDIKDDNIKIEKQIKPTNKQLKLYNKIVLELEVNKVFENPDINLSQLASILKTPSREVSKAINGCSNKTFFDIINSFRIKEAKRIIEDNINQKLTIKEVMYQVGFNSKSSFNTAFKKYVGETPSEFKKKKKENGSSS